MAKPSSAQRRFRKTGPQHRLAMYEAEAEGLAALRATQTVRVPEVFGTGITKDGMAWIELEYLELSPLSPRAGARLGERLAALHWKTGHEAGARFGWPRDNFIGITPQSNRSHTNWAVFFAKERLEPQLARAKANGMPAAALALGERLCERLGAFFLDYQPLPCLLHGDLWAGNGGELPDGSPVIFDPAVYRGDREADLAMAELFGGYPEAFYAAYRVHWPLDAGFETRKTLYNLYHILNHFNMFGASYLNQARRMIEWLLAELKG
ncbi:MAG: fructosamine kinase family protein [Rhodocyclaceae bacterium]